jgi:hypothetical protein
LTLLIHPPFPQTTDWITTNLDTVEADRLREYLWGIEYHLLLADLGETRASEALRSGEWGISHDGSTLYLIHFQPLDIVRFGDIAIRELASSLDAGLQFLNAALALGVGKNDVRWPRHPKRNVLRQRLLATQTPKFEAVVGAVDVVFGSIGSALLHGYRHWVTHRGAPRVRVLRAIDEGIVLPEEIANEADARVKAHKIETLRLTAVPEWLRIECHRFVPPVQAVIDLNIEEAKEDIDIPGLIHIGKGARDITIQDASVGTGSPFDSVEEFMTRNPVVREEDTIRVADEELAVYKPWDYLHALSFAARFVTKALSEEWDRTLVSAMAAGARPPSEPDTPE